MAWFSLTLSDGFKQSYYLYLRETIGDGLLSCLMQAYQVKTKEISH